MLKPRLNNLVAKVYSTICVYNNTLTGLLNVYLSNQFIKDPATPRCQSLGAPETFPGLLEEGGFAAGLGLDGLTAGIAAGAGATGAGGAACDLAQSFQDPVKSLCHRLKSASMILSAWRLISSRNWSRSI